MQISRTSSGDFSVPTYRNYIAGVILIVLKSQACVEKGVSLLKDVVKQTDLLDLGIKVEYLYDLAMQFIIIPGVRRSEYFLRDEPEIAKLLLLALYSRHKEVSEDPHLPSDWAFFCSNNCSYDTGVYENEDDLNNTSRRIVQFLNSFASNIDFIKDLYEKRNMDPIFLLYWAACSGKMEFVNYILEKEPLSFDQMLSKDFYYKKPDLLDRFIRYDNGYTQIPVGVSLLEACMMVGDNKDVIRYLLECYKATSQPLPTFMNVEYRQNAERILKLL